MDKFEFSLKLLQEILAFEIESKKNREQPLIDKTAEIMSAFEAVYRKVSELANEDERIHDSEVKTSPKSLFKAIKVSLEGGTFESFRNQMLEKVAENPKIIDCLDCPKEITASFRESLKLGSTYQKFSQKLSAIDRGDVKCPRTGPQKCPFDQLLTAAKEESEENFIRMLRSLL